MLHQRLAAVWLRRSLVAGVSTLALVAIGACGSSDDGESAGASRSPGLGRGDAAQGQVVFTQSGCGSCHALADAGTTGKVGPDLDRLKPNALKVAATVRNGVPPRMPSFEKRLSPREIDAVAAYVEEATGAEPAEPDE